MRSSRKNWSRRAEQTRKKVELTPAVAEVLAAEGKDLEQALRVVKVGEELHGVVVVEKVVPIVLHTMVFERHAKDVERNHAHHSKLERL